MHQTIPNFQVWKYTLAWKDEQTLCVPKGARPLSVEIQTNTPVIYFHVDPDQQTANNLSTFLVRIAGTGHPLNTETCIWGPNEFIGTVRHIIGLTPYYYHVFAKYV